MFGSMGNHYEALAPQWVTSQNSASAGSEYKWHNVSESAAAPSINNATQEHSAWAQFAATCMYFGVELIDALEAKGSADSTVPIGLIQSAIGGEYTETPLATICSGSCRRTVTVRACYVFLFDFLEGACACALFPYKCTEVLVCYFPSILCQPQGVP